MAMTKEDKLARARRAAALLAELSDDTDRRSIVAELPPVRSAPDRAAARGGHRVSRGHAQAAQPVAPVSIPDPAPARARSRKRTGTHGHDRLHGAADPGTGQQPATGNVGPDRESMVTVTGLGKSGAHTAHVQASISPDRYPKRYAPGQFTRGDSVWYAGERYWIERIPADWSMGTFVRINSQRVHPSTDIKASSGKDTLSFCVPIDCIDPAPVARNPYAKQPTQAGVARAERTKAGVRDVGDPVADMLRAAGSIDDVYRIGAEFLLMSELDLRERYGHLNPGQQRMNVGNKMRAMWKKRQKAGVQV